MKKTKISSFIVFCATALVFGLLGCEAQAVSGTGGLWGQYSKWASSSKGKFVEVNVENIDFDNFDEVLQSRIGQRDDARIFWRGGIYADKSGSYNFRMKNLGGVIQTFRINGVSMGTGWGDKSKNIILEKGWNKFEFFYYILKDRPDSAVRLFWTPPEGVEEVVPKQNLGYRFWSDKLLVIPSDGTKKALDYIAVGEGTRDKTEVSIEVDMPENVLDDDVWFVFYKKSTSTNKIEIKNETTGSDYVNVSGTENFNSMGLETAYPEVYGKVPASLVDDGGSGKMKLKFRKTDDWGDGIALIVPFEDPSKPQGKLSIRMVAAKAYHGASPVMVFPIEPSSEEKAIDPLFFLPNGETKTTSGYRPNYLVMLSGNGSVPGESSTLIKMGAEIIIPQAGPINKSDSKTWYPAYGRDGEQFDAISSKASNSDGKIDPVMIPAGHSWVAFQYYGSNFQEDGVDGSGESSAITGGGLFSEKSIDEFGLQVNVSAGGSVKSDKGAIDCPGTCQDKYVFGTEVHLTATPDPGYNFIPGWGGDCSGFGTDPVCKVVIDSEKTVDADFSALAPPPGGVCGSASGQAFCSEPQVKCYLGNAVDFSFDTASKKWTWKCRHNGIDSPQCSATRSCDIQEITP